MKKKFALDVKIPQNDRFSKSRKKYLKKSDFPRE